MSFKGGDSMTKKKIKYYIFLSFMLIFFNSIKYNTKVGSRNALISYIIWWVVLLIYIVIEVSKYMKSLKQ